jgi:phosphoribosylanthranilate isomerase
MWVKFCGITRLEDAQYARDLGADAIGFVFAKSPRQVTAEAATDIIGRINGIKKVGVFVNEPLSIVKEIQENCGLDFVQLHGEEPPEYCDYFGDRAIKAIRVKDLADLKAINAYSNNTKILLDAFVANQRGGTGKVIDKQILQQIKNPNNIILAGGLTPQNCESILSIIKPFGLDVSSGIEISPGVKDHQKMKNFYETTERFR